MNLKAAAIDIGTNSCRLLVAQNSPNHSLEILRRELRITRLGEGVDESRKLKETAVNRVYKALKEYKEIIESLNISRTKVVGTSALRDVKNPQLLLEKVKKIGFEVEIISGEKEAELNYLGAADNLKDSFLLIDIGGGSTEFVWSENDIINFESLDIGCVRMTERFISAPEKKITKIEAEKLKKYILNLLDEKLKLKKNLKIKGVGGTITTAAAIKLGMEEYDSEKIEFLEISAAELKDIIKNLSNKNLDERKEIKGLQPKRADIITAGLIILESILEFLDSKEMSVSDHDLLYGLLKEELLS